MRIAGSRRTTAIPSYEIHEEEQWHSTPLPT